MSGRSGETYSHLARALHWVSAAVILWAAVTGFLAAVLAGPGLAAAIGAINVSVTTLFIPVFAVRVIWRLFARTPELHGVSRIEHYAARVGHGLLYVLTTTVLLSGVLMIDTDIAVFDWFSLRRPVTHAVVNAISADVHHTASVLLALAIGLHVVAVIRHECRGIPVLRRMLWKSPPQLPRQPDAGVSTAVQP